MPKGKPALSPGEKAKEKPTSLKASIAAYCYHNCVGEEHNNSHATKHYIGNCTRVDCHLWPHRPWQNSSGGNTKEIRMERIEKQAESNKRLAR
ncbi:MAG: hypothetical protein RIR18_2469 [Pseudomonadota bacterium]